MGKRVAKKNLLPEEAAYVKAMLKYTKLNKQQILSYFIRPGYDINQRVITQIARGIIHASVVPVSEVDMNNFINSKLIPSKKDEIDIFCDSLKYRNDVIDNTECKYIEFKASFTERFDNLLKPILGFANADGGFIFYGVSDNRQIIGLTGEQQKKFDNFDLKKINEQIASVASAEIIVLKKIKTISGKKIGIIYIFPAQRKPIISTTNKGSDISLGRIYYRYNAETKDIMIAELEKIIEERTEVRIKNDIMKLLTTILKNGIDNNIILNSQTGEMDLGNKKSFVLDENLLNKINFIKNGKLEDKGGSPVYSIVADVTPIKIEKITIPENVRKIHPLTLTSAVNLINNTIAKTFQNKVKISNDFVKKFLKMEGKYNIWGYHQEGSHGKNILHSLSPNSVNMILEILKTKDQNKSDIDNYINHVKEYDGQSKNAE